MGESPAKRLKTEYSKLTKYALHPKGHITKIKPGPLGLKCSHLKGVCERSLPSPPILSHTLAFVAEHTIFHPAANLDSIPRSLAHGTIFKFQVSSLIP